MHSLVLLHKNHNAIQNVFKKVIQEIKKDKPRISTNLPKRACASYDLPSFSPTLFVPGMTLVCLTLPAQICYLNVKSSIAVVYWQAEITMDERLTYLPLE